MECYFGYSFAGVFASSPPPALAATGINKQINFQGKVVNANGTNVANGNYDFVFSIYTVASAGTAIWTETRTAANQVTVTDGIFRVSLGSITALPGSIDFNTDNIYLGITFNSDGEMTPRVQFTAVPQAFNALKVAGLTVTDTTGTFTLAAAKTLTVNNTLTFAGTDATSFTFPSTTGGTVITTNATSQSITTGLSVSGGTVSLNASSNNDTNINTGTSTGTVTIGNSSSTAIKLGKFTTANGVLYTSATDGTTAETAASTGAQCLQTTGAGLAPVWGACAAGGGITTVRESDASPSVGSLTILEFGPATTSEDEFVVTDQTGGVARVVLGTKAVKTDATQTLSNKTFSSDINFLDANPGTAYIIAGSDSTTTAAAGGDITLRAGAGLTTGAGGNLIIAGGTSPSGTAGYLALQTAGTERFRVAADGTFLFEKGANDVILSVTAPATSTRTYTIPDFGANDSFVGLAATQALTGKTYNGLTVTANGTNTLNIGAGLTLGVSTASKTLTGAGTTLTFAGDFTTSGAFATTLTTSGTTSVTLPTSGTLVSSVTTGNGVSATNTAGALAFTLGAIAPTTTNGLTFVAAATGFTAAGGTTSKTLTVSDSTTLGTNAITLAGGEVITFSATNALSLLTTGTTSVTLPTAGTLLTNTAAAVQTVTSTQSTGTVLGVTDATALTGAIKGAVITLSGANAFDQTGLEFNLSNATGTNLNDIVGSGSTWKVSKAGAATFASTTSPTYTGAGAVTLSSGGSSGLTFDSASGDITVAANDGLTFAATTVGNNGSRNVTINSGTGGTTATLIVKLDTSGTVVTTDTSTLNNAVGVALNTTTAGQAVRVAINGVVTATADNAVTAGDYIGLGTTTAGRAKSLGTTYPSTAGIQVIGRALGNQATPGSTFLLMLNGLDNNVAAGGGGGYNLIKDETTSLTARTTLAFLGTAVTCADNAGLTQTECTISGSGGGVSFASGTPDNTATSNNLIQLQKSGVNRFVVANTGGLTINGTDSSIVRTLTTEFATGALLTNLTNANDQLELSDGTPGNGTITTAGQPVVNVAIGAGSHAITRADGKYQVIVGAGTALTTYDSIAGTFTASAQVLTGIAGAGAIALPKTGGQYRVAHCGGLTTSSLVDPQGNIAVGASVAFTACNAGTVSFRRQNGKYLIANGGAATTQIWDSVADTAPVAGPSATAGTWAAGSLVLPRPDGQTLIVQGGATATTQLYNPNSGTSNIGVFAVGPVLPTGCEINGAGSIAIRKQDGKYIVISKVNAAAIYDPVANTWAQNGTSCTTPLAGKGPRTTALADGAHAIPMQDGKFLILHGGTNTEADIYNPLDDSFTATTAITAGGAGRHSIMRANGTWQLIAGGGTATNNFDTSLPMSGTYQSDDISTTSLNASSTLKWTAQYESPYSGTNAAANTAFSNMQFLVRTAVNAAGCTTPLNSATDRELLTSGDLIRPGSTDNCVRTTIKFNRPIPKQIFDDRGTWTGNNTTVLRRDYATPTLFDIQVDNATVLHRTGFDFSAPNAGSAAPQNDPSGPIMTRVEALSDRLYLPFGRITPTTQNGVTGFYQGAFSGAHPNLSQSTNDVGTIVIARPDKQFLVISAGAANASLYDPASQTFTAQAGAGNIPTAAIAAGAFALKRPDGKFLIIVGGATTTNIYDPNAASGSRFVAGPALTVAAAIGAFAIPNTDGTFTILHGGSTRTVFVLSSSIYDPVRNTMIAGPTVSQAAGIACGAWAVPLQGPNANNYKVFGGLAVGDATAGVIGSTASMNYDARAKIFTLGTVLSSAHGCGSFAFQRQDGYWMTVSAAAGAAVISNYAATTTTTNILNPFTGATIAGPALSVAAGRGAHVIPRADGTYLIVHGAGLLTTTVHFPWGSTFGVGTGIGISAVGPALINAAGPGALSFQRPDGKFVTIVGGTNAVPSVASVTTNIYDAGWYPDGQYLSEQVQVPALAANSTLEWKQTPDNFVRMEVRVAASQAALGNAPYFTVGRPGQSIANAGGETWVQVEVNMRRDFPTFGGSLDGVYVSSSGRSYLYRNISTPTLFEYKLNNGMDLLNLQANGLNILRVTSNGNIYSSSTGGFYSGGADLAENYTSTDSLEKGEVVAIDPTNSHSVKRAGGQYQNNVLGVVSTAPGFVAGAYTEGSFPIALVGRVPVKVSTENGSIKAGDYLTSASIPGYAMKANMAGRVLGKALEDLKDEKACPAFGMGNLATTKCGEIMMFVNLTDYLGSPVELVMQEKQAAADVLGVSEDESTVPSALSSTTAVFNAPSVLDEKPQEQKILSFLKDLKAQKENDGSVLSEVFTDRVAASTEIISPKIVTDILYAKKIKADSIEGLEILTDKISARQTASSSAVIVNSAAQSDSSAETASMSATPQSDTIVTLGNITIETAEVKLDLTVLGKLETQGGLIVGGPAEFKNDTIFNSLVQFISRVIFKGDVLFAGRPTFNSDTAGFAVIKKDADKVEVTFEKEYAVTSAVNVNMTFDPVKLADGSIEDSKVLQKRVIESNYSYFIVNRTTKGFTIVLNKNASEDITLSWIALAVKDAKRFESKLEPTPTVIPVATSSAALN